MSLLPKLEKFRDQVGRILQIAVDLNGRIAGCVPISSEQRTLELKIRPGDTPQRPDEAAEYARLELEKLVRKFEDENQAYTSLNLSMWAARYGAYDDLARIKEWSAAGGLALEEW